MKANLSWVEANLSNSALARLMTRLTKNDRTIETGGCGCGCGDDVTGLKDSAQTGGRAKQV